MNFVFFTHFSVSSTARRPFDYFFSRKQSRKTNLDFDKPERKKKTLCGSFFFFAPSARCNFGAPPPNWIALAPRLTSHSRLAIVTDPRIALLINYCDHWRQTPATGSGKAVLTHFLMFKASSTKWETFQSKTEASCHIQKTTLFENEIYVVTARLAPLRPTEKSETRGLTFKDKRVPVTTCDDDAPLNQC